MNYKILIIAVCILFTGQFVNAQNFTISGYIKDSKSGEDLIGAKIYNSETSSGSVTNTYGFYSLTLPEGDHQLKVSYVGYKESIIKISLHESIQRDILIEEVGVALTEVVVTANKNDITERNIVREDITIQKARTMPKLFGEPDVIKVLQMQPGIKSLGDGSSGMYVRGGNIDQNLVLYDEGTLYNVSHIFGLVSVFNPEIVKNATIYRGAIPAQYGGRLSSVVDVHMREGNTETWTTSGSLSILAASLSASVPLQKGKSSALVAVRRSTFDLLAGLQKGANIATPKFYDINAKVNWRSGKKDRFFLSAYNGRDKITFPSSVLTNNWTNSSVTFRWNHLFSSKLFSNTSLIFNDYKNQLEITPKVGDLFFISSGIRGYTFKSDLTYYHNTKSKMNFGAFVNYKEFSPTFNSQATSNFSNFNSIQYGAYFQHAVDFTPKLNVQYGVRALIYQNVGKAEWYTYDDNFLPTGQETNTAGTYTFYPRVEPRASVNYKFSKKASLKFGYSMTHQFEQLIQNTANAYSSFEIWMPANVNFKPQRGQIFSSGYFADYKKWGFSTEVYYKAFTNQVDYIDHAALLNQPYLETQLRAGNAEAYGVELAVKKNSGKLTGSLSYTYSRAFRTIDGINNGKKYPAPYDMPHDIRLLANYKLSKHFSIAAFWVYSTGRAAQIPIGFYTQGTNPVYIYGERNSSRFPDYHRLDVSLNWTKRKEMKNGKKFEHNFSIGIYNLYYKHNPISIQFPPNLSNPVSAQVVEYSFPRIFPSISYSFSIK